MSERAHSKTRRLAARSLLAIVVSVGIVTQGAPASLAATTPPPAPAPTLAPLPLDNTFPIPASSPVRYEDNWHACRDGCSRQHKGNDIFAAESTPELAVESGVIASISNTDVGNGGLSIWLRGDSGNAYFYAHNSANLVTLGQRVGRGQIIGLVGHTGNATDGASHIHFQINRCGRLDSSEPCTVDPYALLASWQQELTDGGADSIGWYTPSPSTFHLRAEGGSALPPARYGEPGDIPLAGDWDGDGRDTIGVFRPSDSTFSLRDGLSRTVRVPFALAGAGALPFAGDWNGDGRDSVALYRPWDATFYFLDDAGQVVPAVGFGQPGQDLRPLAGDWDGDRRDSVALYRVSDSTFLMLDDAQGNATTPPTGGVAWPTQYGQPGDLPLIGDWDGDGRDSIGVYRSATSTYSLRGFTDVTPAPAKPNATLAARQLTSGVTPPAGPLAFGSPNVPGAVPLAGDWNGRDLVTIDDLVAIFGGKQRAVLTANLPFVNAALIRSGAVTPARKAAFLATIYNESGFRADAVQAGADAYRGRGLIQLTGRGNYQRAGVDLGFDLVNTPGLAANPLVSAAVAGWYWTVARNINLAADRLDMGAVNIAIGYQPSFAEDVERCQAFMHALTWFNGGVQPAGINCARKPGSYALATASSLSAASGSPANSSGSPTFSAPSTSSPTTTFQPPTSTTTPPPTSTTASSSSTTTPSGGGISVPYTPPSSSPPTTDGPVSVPTTPPPPPTTPPTTAPPAPTTTAPAATSFGADPGVPPAG